MLRLAVLLRLVWLVLLLLPWLVLLRRFVGFCSHHSHESAMRLIGRCHDSVLFRRSCPAFIGLQVPICQKRTMNHKQMCTHGGQSRRCDSNGPKPLGPAVARGSLVSKDGRASSSRLRVFATASARSFLVRSSRQMLSRVSHLSVSLPYEVGGGFVLRAAASASFRISRRHACLRARAAGAGQHAAQRAESRIGR